MKLPQTIAQHVTSPACCVLAVLLAACSLAEDITPPPGVESSIRPTATVVMEAGFPATTPSIAAGATLYQDNCIRCHGVAGAGDGELVPQLQFKPANFTDPALAANATPQRWFSIITHGNLERLMPPWGETLTVTQRWHLVAYLYSLTATSARVEAGQAVYEANCLACHGAGGAGDGPEAEGALPSFADQEYMAAKSNQEFLDTLAHPVHNFAGKLPEQEMQAAVDYIRAFSFDRELPELAQGAVTGSLSNGTPGGSLPAGLPVELRLFDNFEPAGSITTTLQGDNTFAFEDIDLIPGRTLIVTTEYDNVLYSSDVTQILAEQSSYDLPITVFDTTTSTAALAVDQMHVVFEINDGVLQAGELFVLSNYGDRTLRAEIDGDPTVPFGLPAGVSALAFQDGAIGDRYVLTDAGFADTLPLRPGTGIRQILVSYKLAYSGQLTFAQPVTLPTANINILLPGTDLTLSGPDIVDGGLQTISGTQFRSYSVSGLEPGDTLTFDIKGNAGSTAPGSPSLVDWRGLLIGGSSLALAVMIVAYWWVDRRLTTKLAPVPVKAPTIALSNLAARREELLTAIAELDELFENGGLPDAAYRSQRDKLKFELRELLEKRSGS